MLHFTCQREYSPTHLANIVTKALQVINYKQ